MKIFHLLKNAHGKFSFSGKPRRVMRLTAFLLLATCLQLSAAVHSQGKKITLSVKNMKLDAFIKRLQKQSEFMFLFNNEKINAVDARVTLDVKEESLEKVLSICLHGLPLSYRIVDQTVILGPPAKGKDEPVQVFQNVSGIITDAATGEALAGVSVRVKGADKGTSSDAAGAYELKNLNEQSTLVFSLVGYESYEVKIFGKTTLNITMEKKPQAMQQVVVIGYGTQKRTELTGAIGTFKPNDLTARPVMGPDQMLQGRIAGVNVSAASGTPGGGNRVSVRGIGSLSASNEPLYVVDGVPVMPHNAAMFNFGESMNPLSELNPNDIESIEVLKDAASASIYGSRATNGVILITTKSGKKGKGQLSVNSYASMQEVPNLRNVKMADSKLYLEVANEAIDNYNNQYGYQPGNSKFIPYIDNPYPGLPDTDWMDLVLRKAYTKSLDIATSGGTEKSTYYISGGYLDQQGTIITNGLKKYMARVNVTSEPLSWLRTGANVSFSYSKNNRVPGSNLGSTIMGRSLPQRPFDRPYKPDGTYYVGGTSDLVYHNPIQILNEEVAYLENYRLLGNAFAELKLAKGLTFKTSFGTDITYTHDYVYYNQNHPYGTGNGRNIDNSRLLSNILTENTLSYSRTAGNLKMEYLAGHSYQQNMTSTTGIDGNGFPAPSFDVLAAAAVINNAGTNLYGNAMESYFGRGNFSWAGKYLLSLSMRTDGSSRFSPANRYGYFPSASAGWQVSKENFWTFPTTDLKLRLSYGATGNQEGVSNYAYQSLTGGGYNYDNKSGIAVTGYGNDILTWEKAQQLNVGFDLALLKGAINVTVDYFDKRTTNLLYNMPIQGTSGFTSIISNIGSMRNKGLELGINTSKRFGDVTWNSDFNISFIRNKILSLIGNENLLSVGNNRGLKVGEDIGSIWVYKMLGLYQDDKEIPQKLYDLGVRAGDIKYEDLNDDGVIDINDRQIVGSSNPDFFGGWNNTFKYKNFDLSLFLTYSSGADVYATWRINAEKLGLSAFNTVEEIAKNRWTGPGTSNTVPRAIYNLGYNIYNSSRWLEDGSFIRVRSLSLGYELPESLLGKAKIKRLRVYAQADNLFLFTKYSGLDPEVSADTDPRFMGEDNLILPQPRSFVLGFNLIF